MIVRLVMVTAMAAAAALLAGCGKTGALYLPENTPASTVVTRPPPAENAPGASRSVDSPQETPSPAPEVAPPAGADEPDTKKKKNGTPPPK